MGGLGGPLVGLGGLHRHQLLHHLAIVRETPGLQFGVHQLSVNCHLKTLGPTHGPRHLRVGDGLLDGRF